MRRPIVAGNWKMEKTLGEAVELVEELKGLVADVEGVDVVVCPPFTSLEAVGRCIKGTNIGLGAQDMHWEPRGAFTGEISAEMLLTTGCRYVILGHSERRRYFGETDETINKKVKAALESDLVPVVCVGETLDERRSGITEEVVRSQVIGVLDGVSIEDVGRVIIAYEPVWAIGTGMTATPEQAEDVHLFIREVLGSLYSATLSQGVRIQYGGSVKPDNAAQLFNQPDIDGGLIGGASLKADSFARIIKSAV